MRAHRGIDAAGAVQLVRADDFLVQRFAHAVQALELVSPGGEVRPGHGVDRRQRVRVVRGELREHRVRGVQQAARAGDIGDIGVDLAGIDREIGQPVHLRPFDLGVPVGALDQPHHDSPARPARQRDDPVDHMGAALAIALHHEAKTVPAGKIGIERQAFQQVEREFEPVGFLGVDVEADVEPLGEFAQALHARQEFGHHAIRLRAGIARMERGELDRDAWAVHDAAPGRCPADGADRVLVIGQVARRVVRRHRGLAQHVVAVAEAFRLQFARALQRFLDGAAGDELFAHHPHGQIDAAPDDRFAGAGDEAGQRVAEVAVVDAGGELARNHQPPGGGVDEQRSVATDMGAPVATGDLVADQGVARGVVGNAQQGFGKAHQRHAFLRGEREFLHELVHAAALGAGA